MVDDLGGTKAPNYTGVGMTNEPKTSATFGVFKHLFYALKLAATFGKADSNPGIRQVYEISEMGESIPEKVKTPKWMMAKAAPGQEVDEKDFRDELRVENYGGNLVVEIYAADKKFEDGSKNFKRIGHISFTESVVSTVVITDSLPSPKKWKSNLNH